MSTTTRTHTRANRYERFDPVTFHRIYWFVTVLYLVFGGAVLAGLPVMPASKTTLTFPNELVRTAYLLWNSAEPYAAMAGITLLQFVFVIPLVTAVTRCKGLPDFFDQWFRKDGNESPLSLTAVGMLALGIVICTTPYSGFAYFLGMAFVRAGVLLILGYVTFALLWSVSKRFNTERLLMDEQINKPHVNAIAILAALSWGIWVIVLAR